MNWRDLYGRWKSRIRDRQANRCIICGDELSQDKQSEDYESVEHVVPISRGGTNEDGNIALSHLRCNRARGNANFIPYLNEVVSK